MQDLDNFKENAVNAYCEAFKQSDKSAKDFAIYARARWPRLCLRVMEEIGSWPSSEQELSELQKQWR